MNYYLLINDSHSCIKHQLVDSISLGGILAELYIVCKMTLVVTCCIEMHKTRIRYSLQ